LVISKYSFDRGKKLDYYILVEIDKDWDTAEIIGYATKKDFLENSTVKDLKTRMVYAIPIKSLKPFEELLKIFKKPFFEKNSPDSSKFDKYKAS
ncbi:MAG: DUF1822 family protein, partial [Nanoarchaeota archaeon]|nr:DUF1822 family protein [Nanoarchaeota archaeon]